DLAAGTPLKSASALFSWTVYTGNPAKNKPAEEEIPSKDAGIKKLATLKKLYNYPKEASAKLQKLQQGLRRSGVVVRLRVVVLLM
ncbi:hypothetical protein AA0117_g13154, partial [Alternaria alternata]